MKAHLVAGSLLAAVVAAALVGWLNRRSNGCDVELVRVYEGILQDSGKSIPLAARLETVRFDAPAEGSGHRVRLPWGRITLPEQSVEVACDARIDTCRVVLSGGGELSLMGPWTPEEDPALDVRFWLRPLDELECVRAVRSEMLGLGWHEFYRRLYATRTMTLRQLRNLPPGERAAHVWLAGRKSSLQQLDRGGAELVGAEASGFIMLGSHEIGEARLQIVHEDSGLHLVVNFVDMPADVALEHAKWITGSVVIGTDEHSVATGG